MAEQNRVVGIDLGTTNSLVAFLEGGTPVVIPGEDGSSLVPSVVAIEGGNVTVGNGARGTLLTQPGNAVYSAKRLMGRGIEDVRDELAMFPFQVVEGQDADGALKLKVGDRTLTPPEISAMVLGQLKKNAERYFGQPVTRAVITVPAYFNDAQRQATKDAGRIAGLDVLRLVNEPTAAALAYGLDRKKEGTVAVYDFGGGTFDVSILKLHDGIFEVISTNGDTHLGGDDIDNLLMHIALDEIANDLGLPATPEIVQAVRKAVIEVKITLSSADSARFDLELTGGKRYRREITREQFEQLIAPVITRTAAPAKQALKDAGITPEQIDEVVLVGGSTRIPAVRKLVDEVFTLSARGKSAHTELNPDEVVALGAAVQADILAGGSAATNELLLLDVTPLSLGIEALGGVVAKIIQRNSTIPASATEHFTTGVDGQTNVAIHVVQGERELAKDCRSLARFDLKNIPPMTAGMPRIEVKFLIDANGILQVSAREQRSGQAAEVEVKPSYGLTDDQVEEMILASFDHAEDDLNQRQLIEATNEANTIKEAVEKGQKHPAWQQLTPNEIEKIHAAQLELDASIRGQDYKIIRAAIDRLDKATTRFAELMMDTAVSSALTGKTMGAAGDDMGTGPSAPHPFAPAQIDDSKTK
ncbi:Chaperone protein HscA [Terriglobus roseus DSM 18391]|uniref:Chaperone protein DnaK n=1 Tax=Terriglobus roseus (strain DSM 18391 / NRRL B-41598 / KBS 63) TaxID=926566 RepID=I3ZMA6_TERRK|nr:Fe-S protein assembly chaperone HscA [Terriglobus roseus]AFL90374.1 Chaperone protein HscA [Terriglobus roseus DSM 18391]